MLLRLYSISLFIFFFVSTALTGFSQDVMAPGQYTSTDKKAIKNFQEGKRYYDARQDKKSEEFLLKAIKEDPAFMEPHMILARIYGEQGKLKETVAQLSEAIKKGPKYYVENYFFIAETEFTLGEYENAKAHYEQFLKFPRINPNEKDDAEFKLKSVAFATESKRNPKNVKFTNMGEAINSSMNEYFPTITADEKYFIYTRETTCEKCYVSSQEDLYMARSNGQGGWSGSAVMNEFSSTWNEGAPTISADGNYMFITMEAGPDGLYMGGQVQGYGSCDIFYTQKVNGRWSKPVNIGPEVNTSMWESQPSFSSDGKTLYFVRGTRQRMGKAKDVDIYYSEIGPDGRFSRAMKVPGKVNTDKEEQGVFIHPDNQTMYFSSRGHVGMGGLDIFMSKRTADGSWGEPVNLGYPINTPKDESSLIVSPSGRTAYFSSEGQDGFGGLDIYQFDMPESLRPELITYVKGKVYNAKTKEPLEANLELIDLETQQQVLKAYSQKNGEFLATLTANKNYLVNVNKENFLFYSDNFSLKEIKADFNKPFQLDIPLEPIDVGSVVELKNVFFDVDKWELKPESKAELEKLSAFLTKNPGLKVELGGHTDNSGDKKNNLTLSSNRAKAVYEYLVTQGKIAPARLQYKGYGDTMPKVPNDSPENKAKNRRTEFKIIGK